MELILYKEIKKKIKKADEILNKKGNVKVLQELFSSDEDPKFENMPESFNEKELITWLSGKTKGFKINSKEFKDLKESGRLIPDVGKRRYSRELVMEYYLETKPRGRKNA